MTTDSKGMKNKKEKGSLLVIAMIFGTLLITTAGILLNYGVAEKSINQRHFMLLEAQAAAESAVEYGFAQLQDRWIHKTNFRASEIRDNPLELPQTINTFFGGSNVDVSSMSIIAGLVSDGRWVFINPKDPANMLDPQKQKLVFTRDVEVFGTATVNAPNGLRNQTPIEIYCAQILEVRDAPIFGHAIFYNMDLELHPGPRMNIHGPVHCNQNIYVQAGEGISFHSNVMAAGEIWHRYKPDNSRSSAHLAPVLIKDSEGNWKDMYKGSGDKMADSSYYDSAMGEDWKSESEERWGGIVGTIDHEVPNMKALSIEDFVPDNPETAGINELENHAYALIEPQLGKSNPDYKGSAIQKEQFSYKAGLILKVTEDATIPSGYDYNFYSYMRADANEPNSARILDGNGKPVRTFLDKINLPPNMVRVSPYSMDGNGNPAGGFYDQRQAQGMDVIDIDVGLLRTTVDSSDPAFDANAWNNTYKLQSSGTFDWNGIVYVEIPTLASASGRKDNVKKAKSGIAVRLKNGSIVPSPPGSPDKGFTVATNAPLYVLGNYNADGNSSTGSATATDGSDEVPAALVADAITILSNAWEANNYDSKSKQSSGLRKGSFTEISAAFLTGQSETVPGAGKYSGGVHNFPRFLENWTGTEFRYRGSLVALFQSEVNWKHMNNNSYWYAPPKRNWGFSSIFEGGEFPPGTPMVRDFRRKHFRFLTKGEYVTQISE